MMNQKLFAPHPESFTSSSAVFHSQLYQTGPPWLHLTAAAQQFAINLKMFRICSLAGCEIPWRKKHPRLIFNRRDALQQRKFISVHEKRPSFFSVNSLKWQTLIFPKEIRQKNDDKIHIPWRIHGAAIYGDMDPINIPPVMLALIYQHHGSYMGMGWIVKAMNSPYLGDKHPLLFEDSPRYQAFDHPCGECY